MSDPSLAARRAAFMAELSALSIKHGIVIGACGCCASPWLVSEHHAAGRYSCADDGGELLFAADDAKQGGEGDE